MQLRIANCIGQPQRKLSRPGLHTGLFLRVGNVDACNRHMRIPFHPLGFGETLLIFKDENHRIQLNFVIACVVYIAVEAIMTS